MHNWLKTIIGVISFVPLFANSQEVFVYPAQGQSTEQQTLDKAECTEWAKQQTGFDPMNPPNVEVASVEDKSGGAAARGVVRGAIVGSVVGKATDLKRTESAAAGAVIGGVRSGRSAQAQQQAQANQAQQQANADMANRKNTYNRAYKSCLEGRGYTAN
jgi:hypothetical protein